MPELTEQMYCHQQICIPPAFPYLLRQYAKAAIRTQPVDLLKWSTAYWRCLALNIPPPVKPRLEYPIPRDYYGITPGWLKALNYQFLSAQTVPFKVLWDRWIGACLQHDTLVQLLCLGAFTDNKAIPWNRFIALCAGTLTDNLTQTMILICEILTEEPEGGSAMISVETFLDLYKFLAAIDASELQTLINMYFTDSALGLVPKKKKKIKKLVQVELEESAESIAESSEPTFQEETEEVIDLGEGSVVSCPDIASDDVYPESVEMPGEGEPEPDMISIATMGFDPVTIVKEEGGEKQKAEENVEHEDLEVGHAASEQFEEGEEEKEAHKDKDIGEGEEEVRKEEDKQEKFVDEENSDEVKEDVESIDDVDEKDSPDEEEAEEAKEKSVIEALDEKAVPASTVEKDVEVMEHLDAVEQYMKGRDLEDQEAEEGQFAAKRPSKEKQAAIDAADGKAQVVHYVEVEMDAEGEEEDETIYEEVQVDPFPGIGPVVPLDLVEAVVDYFMKVSVDDHGMAMPRHIRHYSCPPLEVVDNDKA